ncbi:MAG TPA: type II toxin-antitoxin system prevent-host-death family antitoxin [Planctomycetaceae bacterium]|nr:type II toxin-antitoxin system prevent-host-death family antitoxin [Planctomycetaceae bacterium]
MKTVSMLRFRQNAEEILKSVERGERIVLTYRGKPIARLEPIAAPDIPRDDPFYTLDELADTDVPSLTNTEMDETVYGQ